MRIRSLGFRPQTHLSEIKKSNAKKRIGAGIIACLTIGADVVAFSPPNRGFFSRRVYISWYVCQFRYLSVSFAPDVTDGEIADRLSVFVFDFPPSRLFA